jgi:gliding motility-associated-like protein
MTRLANIYVLFCSLLITATGWSQSANPSPYCSGGQTSGNCLQGTNQTNNQSNFVNDFIDFFRTSGGSTNISNDSSGCNQNPNNFAFYCSQILATQVGDTIVCTMKSGITFAQGFAIFIDWNQDNTFQVPAERVAATSNVPAAATWTTLTFVIPNVQPGIYRMRVRCAYATAGTNITPCGTFSHGETEDYNIVVGNVPITCAVVTATPSASTPLCAGQSISLSVVTNSCSGLTFTWTGPSYTSTSQNVIRANSSPTMSGTYSVIISNSVCPITKTVQVNVIPYPNISVSPLTPTICQGGNFIGSVTFPTGPSQNNFAFQWAPTSGSGFIFSQYAPSTSITPLPLPANQVQGTVMYSITVSPTVYTACKVTKTITVTINNPQVPGFTVPSPLCNTNAPITLTATPGGGVWSGHNAVFPNGILTPTLVTTFGTQTVMYATNIGSCVVTNTMAFSVSKFNSPSLTSSLNIVCEQDQGHNLMNLVQNVSGSWSGPGVTNNIFYPSNFSTGVYFVTYNTVSTPVTSVCPSSTILAINVFDPPTPTISPISPRCSNETTVALSATPAGGVWSNNSGVTVNGIQTPSLNLAGTNIVNYVAGQGTCVASTSTTFHVSHFRTAAFTSSIQNLCANFNPYNLMSIVQNTTGTWSGMGVNNNFFKPAGLPTNDYHLKYITTSFPDPKLCPDTGYISVGVINPPKPQITQVGPYCIKDGTVQLSVTPPIGSWTPLNYLTSNGVFTPSLAIPGSNLVQYVIGTATCNTTDLRYIDIEGFVAATLVSDRIPDQCQNNLAFNLTPISINAMGTWSGTAVSGTNFDPSMAGAGDFVLSYHTKSSPTGLCVDQSTIAVTVFSLAPPVIIDEGPFCDKSAPVQVRVAPVGGMFKGANTDAIESNGIFHPSRAVVGENIISYSISSGPCISYAHSTITVEKFVSAVLVEPPLSAYCENSPAFNLNSLAQNPGGIWYGTGVTGSIFDPSQAITNGNNLVVYRTGTENNRLLCPDSSSIRIYVQKIPVVKLASDLNQHCAPAEVVLNLTSSNGGTGSWNLGNGKTLDGLKVPYIFTSPGSYSITFNYTLGACVTQAHLDNPIEVYVSPNADFEFSKDFVSISDPHVQLINRTGQLGDNYYTWTYLNELNSFEVNPVLSFTKTGIYEVELEARNHSGCSHSITKLIEVKNDYSVFIPNSFTPNYDGKNDIFKPVFSSFGIDSKNYRMEIYDRWGHLVFSTTELNSGWDGSADNQNDLAAKQETYVYKIQFKDMEGTVHHREGYLLLLPH